MTVLIRGTEPALLVCDGCGFALTVAAGSISDDELAWPILVDNGWDGSPFVTGSHRCPSCSVGSDRPSTRPEPVKAQPQAWPPAWRVELHGAPGVVVFRPNVDMTAEVADLIEGALADAIPSGQHIVLDMSEVNVIEPPGLALLVRAHQAVKRRGGVLCLAAPSRFVVTVLHTMRLNGVFPTFDSCEQALAWLHVDAGGGTRVPAQPHGNQRLRDLKPPEYRVGVGS